MPERFAGLEIDEASEAIVPVGFSGSRAYLDPNNRWDIIARLKPGVTLAQAQAQLAVLRWGVLLASLPPSLPAAERDRFLALRFDVESAATGVSYLRYRFLRPLQILMALVGLVLLIGCVNLANWTLARASGRRRELGIRIALGARPARLASQMFLESLLLSAAGATLGVSVAQWAPHFLLSAIWTGHVPPALDTTPDALVLVFMAVVAVITGVLFGLAPARHAWRIDPSVLLEGGARAVRGSGRWTVRSLMAVQIAVSLVLVIGASLFARAIVRLYAVDLGYRTDHVLALELYPRSPYSRLPDRVTYYRELSAALGRLPGVQSVGYCNIGPATAYEYRQPVSVPGPAQGSFQAAEDSVGPGFFRMIGMRLLAGREFSWRDVKGERRVAIVSESLARRLFPGRNPIGARIDIDTESDAKGMEIVGVVNSASLWTPKSQQPMAIYVPVMQSSVRDFSVYLRTTVDPNLVAAAARQVLASAGHHYALRTDTLERRLDGALVNDRIVAMLAGFLGIVALMLASVGLYGVMDGVVTRREPEIGVRMALGASRAQVLRMVLGNGVALVAPGLVIGILASLAGSRLLGATYEIPRLDPSAIALASAILCSAALLGTWVPAVRASRLDPMSAVRSE